MRFQLGVAGLIALSFLAGGTGTLACEACGCTLNSDWASQGYAVGAGFRVDFRYDYFDQDDLRTGLGTVDTGTITLPADREIQLQTINRNFTLDLNYSPNLDWGFSLHIPACDRTHSTIAEGDLTPSYSRSAGIGDIIASARYQGFSRDQSWGIQLGVKLPTGRTDDRFSSGPRAGEPVDRGLQLGTGTTDLLAGAFKFGSFSPKWGYFAQIMVQFPLDSSKGFRPGDSVNLSAGLRYTGYERVTPHLQLNLKAEKPETGAEADTANSGATLVYLSPGFTVNLSARGHLYAFVQVPVYQRVDGYQLMPRVLASIGAHFSF